jgi:hypothetical protein
VLLGGEIIVSNSRDPEHDLARALLGRGITGVVEVIDGKTGKPRSRVNIEQAAKLCVGSNLERYIFRPLDIADSSPHAGETEVPANRVAPVCTPVEIGSPQENFCTDRGRSWPAGERGRGCAGGDAVRLGRQHVRDGITTIRTEKSGGTIEVTLPILPVLAETLAAGPCGDLAYICGARGEPLTKESFVNLFRDACKGLSCRDQRTASERSQRHARPMVAPLSRSWRRSSGGWEERWLPTTRGAPTEGGLPPKQSRSWRAPAEHLFPHLCIRCGQQEEKQMKPMLFFEGGAVERNRTSTG